MRGQRTILRVANMVRGRLVGVRDEAKKVAIVSCDRWKGKVYDDLLLQREFLRRGMDARIVSWQDVGVRWGDFEVAVVGSMWGYQNFLQDFEKWLERVGDETVLVNAVEVIRRNYNKAEQFRALEQVGVPVINTRVVEVGRLDEFRMPEGEFVIKPAISGSGENTFLVRNAGDFDKLRNKLQRLNETKELLVQPFVPEIRVGELGVVVIGGEVVNVVRRFPGVIEGGYRLEVVKRTEIPKSVEEIVRKVMEMPEYSEATYLRIDVVERDGGAMVMEVEAFEPQLYYFLLKGVERQRMLARMVTEVMAKCTCKS